MSCILSCREFGARVFNLKILMKSILPLFEHNDKNVRAEVRTVYVLYCSLGHANKVDCFAFFFQLLMRAGGLVLLLSQQLSRSALQLVGTLALKEEEFLLGSGFTL